MSANSNGRFRTLEELTARLQYLRGIPLTWHKIAAMGEFGGSSAGLLCNVLLNGYEPKSPLARKKLNLPPLVVEVEPCGDCGEAHVVGWCVKVAGEPVKPKPPLYRKRPPRPRIRIAADVSEAQRDALHDYAGRHGITWSEFCKRLADNWLSMKEKEGDK